MLVLERKDAIVVVRSTFTLHSCRFTPAGVYVKESFCPPLVLRLENLAAGRDQLIHLPA